LRALKKNAAGRQKDFLDLAETEHRLPRSCGSLRLNAPRADFVVDAGVACVGGLLGLITLERATFALPMAATLYLPT
jgi:hypothetical protein